MVASSSTTPAPAGEPYERRNAVLWAAALLAIFAVLATLTRIPVWGSPETLIGGGGDDPLQMAWFLRWGPYALTHHASPFLTHHLNAPTGTNLLWNTSVPAASLLLWPVTALGNAVLTYNVLVTAALALSAWCAYFAIHRYARTRWACALGGLLYGFSPLMSAQELGHAQVLASAIFVPLVLILLDELLVRQRMRWWVCGLLLAGVGVLQFFIFEEYFVTTMLAGAILVVLLLITGRSRIREQAPYALRALTVAATVVAALLIYPIVALQLGGPGRIAGAIHDSDVFSSDPLNFILPTRVIWLSPGRLLPISQRFSGNASEADAYLGIPLLVLLLGVLVRFWRLALVRVAGLFGIVIALLSLGPHLHFDGHKSAIPLPWWVPAHLPFLESILPSRLTMFMFLAVAVLFAFALERLRSWRGGWWPPALAAALVFVTIAPLLPFTSETYRVPQFFSSSAVSVIPEGTTVYGVPWPGPPEMTAMNGQVAADNRFRILGGYFLGPPAPGQDALVDAAGVLVGGGLTPRLSPTQRAAVMQELSANHVGAVMLTPVANQAAIAAYLSTIFGPPASDQGGVVVWLLSQGASTGAWRALAESPGVNAGPARRLPPVRR